MIRKIWFGIKKYRFVLFFLTAGVSFLSFSDNWGVYGDPIRELGREWGLSFAASRAPMEEDLPQEMPGESAEQPEEDSPQEVLPENPGQGEPETETQPEEERPAKTWGTVGEEYFDDALFIGDSRTVGLRDYGNFGEKTTFYASTGLTIFKLFTAEIVEKEGQRNKISVEEALGERQFRKIYLMLGINELGTGDVERFEKAYAEAVEHIRELQPEAVIYIQSIMKVTVERSEEGDYITNEGIVGRNEAICGLADGESVFYLDVNEVVIDETGGMNPEYTTDGVHLKAIFIPLWKEFLKSHAIEW